MQLDEVFAVMSQIRRIFFEHFPSSHPTLLSMEICSQQANQVFKGYWHKKPAVVRFSVCLGSDLEELKKTVFYSAI